MAKEHITTIIMPMHTEVETLKYIINQNIV